MDERAARLKYKRGRLMARIRTVKPQFFRHRRLFLAERETGLPLRVAFAGLWTAADRDGRFRWEPDELKLDCLPYDDVDFSRVLDALATGDFVVKYSSGGRDFGVVPSFPKHQFINNRESGSVLPPPPDELLDRSRQADASATRGDRVKDLPKGKGREGNKEEELKGREGETRAPASILLSEDWNPSLATVTKAKALGLTGDDLSKMLLRFGPHYRSRGEKRADWNEQFLAWCADEAEKRGRTPPRPPELAEPEHPDDPCWAPIKAHLLAALGPDVCKPWFGNAVVVSVQDEIIVLSAPTRFIISHWKSQLLDKIELAVKAAYPKVTHIDLVVAPPATRTLNSHPPQLDLGKAA